jgi:hypothetical protein
VIASLLTAQYSGSYFLGTAIGSHPDIYHMDELEIGELVSELRESGRDILEAIEDLYDEPIKLVSLKYNSINKVTMPLLSECKVIHLYRNDFKRMYYSYIFCEQRKSNQEGEFKRGTWKPKIAKRDDRTYQEPIDPDKIVWDGSDGKRAFNNMKDGILKSRNEYDPYTDLVLVYEELTDNKETHEIPEKYGRQICELLGIEYKKLTTPLVKKSPTDPWAKK